MISRKGWKQVDWKKFRMRKSLKTKILKKMKNKYTFLAEGAVKHALSVSLYEGGNTSCI